MIVCCLSALGSYVFASAQGDVPVKLEIKSPEVRSHIDACAGLIKAGKYKEAAAEADQAISAAEAEGDPVDKSAAMRSQALAYERMPETGKAPAIWKKSAQAWEDLNEPVLQLEALGRLILGSNSDTPDSKAAIDAFARVAVKPGNNPDDLVLEAAYVAEILQATGRLSEASDILQPYYDLAAAQHRDTFSLGRMEYLLGVGAFYAGDLNTAEKWMKMNVALYEKVVPNSVDLAQSYMVLASAAQTRSDLGLASHWLQRALAIQEKTAPGSYDLASAYNLEGNIQWKLKQKRQAQETLLKSVAIFEKVGPNSLGIASSYSTLGLLAQDRNDFGASKRWYSKAVPIYERYAPKSPWLAVDYGNIGWMEENLHHLDAARDYLQKSIAMRKSVAPNSTELITACLRLGQVDNELGQYREAVSNLTDAAEVARYQRAKLANVASKEMIENWYDRYVTPLSRAYLGLHQPEQAFQASNQRGQVMRMWLASKGITAFESATPEQLKERDQLQLDILSASKAAEASKDPVLAKTQRQKVWDLSAQLRDLEQDVARAHPEAKSLEEPPPYDVAAAQAALDPGTLLLQYLVDDDEVLLFTLSKQPGSLHCYQIPISQKDLTKLCLAFRRSIVTRGNSLELGRTLYDLLIKPAGKDVAESDRLLISPEKILDSLPFGALVHESQETRLRPITAILAKSDAPAPHAEALQHARFLLDDKPLHLIVSLGVYGEVRHADTRSGDGGFLAYGDPAYHGTWPELAASRPEVEDAASMLKGRAKVGEAATVEALLKDAGSSGILHLACHTKLDPEDSLGSSLVLAPGGSKGLLPAYEIVQKMNLHCNLVTLSACDTGSGFAFAHEGVLGIARAFQLAGARSVLMSMWQVADQSTSLLMRNFYKRLAHGAPKDVALRQAAIETRRKFPQPFYWAPFVLSGDWK